MALSSLLARLVISSINIIYMATDVTYFTTVVTYLATDVTYVATNLTYLANDVPCLTANVTYLANLPDR